MKNSLSENQAAKEIDNLSQAYYEALGEELPSDVLLLGRGMVWYKERMLEVMKTKDLSLWYRDAVTFDSNDIVFV